MVGDWSGMYLEAILDLGNLPEGPFSIKKYIVGTFLTSSFSLKYPPLIFGPICIFICIYAYICICIYIYIHLTWARLPARPAGRAGLPGVGGAGDYFTLQASKFNQHTG